MRRRKVLFIAEFIECDFYVLATRDGKLLNITKYESPVYPQNNKNHLKRSPFKDEGGQQLLKVVRSNTACRRRQFIIFNYFFRWTAAVNALSRYNVPEGKW
jgi:hypothetical protein|uniref:Uncharacterized protein n=1 Tax=Sipha flava TaxID=143950 RepID=A0A2S2PZ98_9HEMI